MWISKTGDSHVRRLLVGSAQYILGPFGPDCDLRRWGAQAGRTRWTECQEAGGGGRGPQTGGDAPPAMGDRGELPAPEVHCSVR
jgi:hypothetical protein